MRLQRLLAVCAGIAMVAGSASAQESLTLKKIKETGVITLGFRNESLPFSYLDARQRPVGYSLDICQRIVDAVKANLKMSDLQVKLTSVTSATRIPMVVNNTIDLECGSTTNTVDRQKQVSFVVTTFVASIRLVSKVSSNIRSLNELRGKTVVSTAGTTSIRQLVELNATHELQMNILAGKDHVDSFHLVETDRAAAFVMDDVLLYGLVATARKPSDYRISADPLSVEPYGIMVRKNDPAFKKLADHAIIDLYRSGEINQLYLKWFQAPIPPRQINLQLPMSAALSKVIAHPTDSPDPAHYR